jgi:hypothetical protein
MIVTSSPWTSAPAKWEPIKPKPPVIATCLPVIAFVERYSSNPFRLSNKVINGSCLGPARPDTALTKGSCDAARGRKSGRSSAARALSVLLAVSAPKEARFNEAAA